MGAYLQRRDAVTHAKSFLYSLLALPAGCASGHMFHRSRRGITSCVGPSAWWRVLGRWLGCLGKVEVSYGSGQAQDDGVHLETGECEGHGFA